MTIPITFEVPAHPEPVLMVREWAMGLRDGISRAGENYPGQSDIDGLLRIVVEVPKDEDPFGEFPVYQDALACLVMVNLWCLRAARKRTLGHPPYPPVYEMACYAPDPPGVELWGSIESLFLRGEGDCEDISCARIAERLSVGDACRPRIESSVAPDRSVLHHILIDNPDGTTEDPSELLGMKFGEANGDPTIARCRARIGRSNGRRQGISRQEARKRFW